MAEMTLSDAPFQPNAIHPLHPTTPDATSPVLRQSKHKGFPLVEGEAVFPRTQSTGYSIFS